MLKGKWIPCKERLPEEETKYLVTTKGGDVLIAMFSDDTEITGQYHWTILKKGLFRGYEMLAWAELPPPYVER